jgi:hypothetical protein
VNNPPKGSGRFGKGFAVDTFFSRKIKLPSIAARRDSLSPSSVSDRISFIHRGGRGSSWRIDSWAGGGTQLSRARNRMTVGNILGSKFSPSGSCLTVVSKRFIIEQFNASLCQAFFDTLMADIFQKHPWIRWRTIIELDKRKGGGG